MLAQTSAYLNEGDVLVVKDGATTGKTALVRKDFAFSETTSTCFCFGGDPAQVARGKRRRWSSGSRHGYIRRYKGLSTEQFCLAIPVGCPRSVSQAQDSA
jgi:hypothetical protein